MSTSEKIEQATMQLMAAKGIDAVSMRDISKVVGVTEPALYRHFASKDALVWHCFTKYYDIFAADLTAAQALHDDTLTKLVVIVQIAAQLFDRQRDIFCFLLMTQHIQRSGGQYDAALPNLLKALISQGIARGEIIAQNIELSVSMLMGVVLQTASHLWYRNELMTPHIKPLSAACWAILNKDKLDA